MQTQTDDLREQFRAKQIAVLCGGMSPERDVSLQTGAAICEALKQLGYRVCSIDVTPKVTEQLRSRGIEVAFLALHGPYGEDGTIQGLLEIMGIPYTGSGVLASAVAMNKAATKKMLRYHGLPTPDFQTVIPGAPRSSAPIGIALPCVVKPAEGGSTIGISIVHTVDELDRALEHAGRYDREILIEQYIKGREITAAVLDGEALPLIEIRPRSGFYDYQAKYHSGGTTQYIIDPELPRDMGAGIQDLACAAYQAIGCSGAARIDFILEDDGRPFILEINTIPGMTASSLLPKAAQYAGIDFGTLVERILWGARLHKRPHNSVHGSLR